MPARIHADTSNCKSGSCGSSARNARALVHVSLHDKAIADWHTEGDEASFTCIRSPSRRRYPGNPQRRKPVSGMVYPGLAKISRDPTSRSMQPSMRRQARSGGVVTTYKSSNTATKANTLACPLPQHIRSWRARRGPPVTHRLVCLMLMAPPLPGHE